MKIRVLRPDNFYPDAVYVGCVRKKKDNIDASFVSYGNKQFGFLKKGDIKPGTLLPVIVKKQTDGHKEDVLTDKISLCGVYIVLYADDFTKQAKPSPDNIGKPKYNGSNIKFSSKLPENFKTDFLNKLAELNISNFKDNDTLDKNNNNIIDIKNINTKECNTNNIYNNYNECININKYGVIIRSNAVNADFDSIINEYSYLSAKLDRIIEYSNTRTEGTLLYHGMSECISHIASEDFSGYDEIVTDDKTAFDEINLFVSEYSDAGINVPLKIRWYNDSDYPLYKLISIKKLLSLATDKKVYLKSNAYITIEHTEAMTVIDVNTSTTVYKGTKADVVHSVNMEAADEIAVQLKLRNISGIIIIDFINEDDENNKKELVNHIKNILKYDDANARFISYTKLGLVELTRDRKSKPLKEQLKS